MASPLGWLFGLFESGVSGDAERLVGCGSGPTLRCRALRTDRSFEGHTGGFLPVATVHPSWASPLEGSQVAKLAFETALIKRYKRRESSAEEALVKMYLAGVSVRRVEDITEALWGTRVSPSTVSKLNQKIYTRIETWRNRPLERNHPYVFLDGLWLKRRWGGEVRSVSLRAAMRVKDEG
jgi:hypothetical protein